MVQEGYEAHFGLVERPFSLTPDPKYYFRSRSHTRAFETLTSAIARRESMMLVAGDLGLGKTTLCRTLAEVLQRKTRTAMAASAFVSPDDLLRRLLQDFGAVSKDEARRGRLTGASHAELRRQLDDFLLRLQSGKDGAVLIVDEAHGLPALTVDLLVSLAGLELGGEKVLQIVLAGQPPLGGAPTLARPLDERLSARARLLPLERDECERYIAHRVTIAGGTGVAFSSRAVEAIYSLSGGVPRLVNLLAERALQEGAAQGAGRIEPQMIESAASALELLRLRPRRFRWFAAHGR
jgi:general secretion pathway protein A